jgi:hypothetical protein
VQREEAETLHERITLPKSWQKSRKCISEAKIAQGGDNTQAKNLKEIAQVSSLGFYALYAKSSNGAYKSPPPSRRHWMR